MDCPEELETPAPRPVATPMTSPSVPPVLQGMDGGSVLSALPGLPDQTGTMLGRQTTLEELAACIFRPFRNQPTIKPALPQRVWRQMTIMEFTGFRPCPKVPEAGGGSVKKHDANPLPCLPSAPMDERKKDECKKAHERIMHDEHAW